MKPNQKYSLAIHGGAGTIKKSTMTSFNEKKYLQELENALEKGSYILQHAGSALDAVEATVKILEDSPLFNAGKGSVFTHEGTHELDASIMCGATLKAGAVAAVRNLKNPVELARKIMDESEYVLLCGPGAEEFARFKNLAFESDEYFYTENRYNQWKALQQSDKAVLDHDSDKKFGTVGAVALDVHGNVAAATSTGGLTNKKFGRLGDSCVIGSGNYANNNTCAISCTGYGEYFIRAVVAYDISCLMEYKSLTLKEACRVALNKLTKIGGEGGFIAVDAQGNLELVFNTEGMYRGSVSSDERMPLKAEIYNLRSIV